MNMVQVYIKGQEDKELISFLRYYPVRIKNIGMDAFFDLVGERTAVHGTKVKKEERAKRLKEKNNIEVDANFFKNKIVCIWDDVVTTGTSFCAYTAQLEQVGAHVTNGIFLGKTSYKYVQQ